MLHLKNKEYIAVVQCDIAKQRCSGYNCERAFNSRTGGFADYPKNKQYRIIYLTCGGCCGRATGRKLSNLIKRLRKDGNISKDKVVVQLSSCITKDNFHAPPCPHLDYIKTIVARLGLDLREDTHLNELSDKRRKDGSYRRVI